MDTGKTLKKLRYFEAFFFYKIFNEKKIAFLSIKIIFAHNY